MTDHQATKQHYQSFEEIRKLTDEGLEFWSARQLLPILEYNSWDKFKAVIKKAIRACNNSGIQSQDHFSQMGKMLIIGSGAERYIEDYDYHLSRYACYLIVQNGDPSKPVIANGQTYFALQTRRQELANDASFQELDEEKKRVLLRNELKEHNKQLVETANLAGVESGLDFAIFQNHGYKGLYGGLDAKNIHQKKGLKKSQQILDHMGSTELAANLFRATQTEEKLRRDSIKGKQNANQTHFAVGAKVRQTIEDLGGTMPENLPTLKTNVKTLEKLSKNYISISNEDVAEKS
jgi:DNA-damage-inducible protein D